MKKKIIWCTAVAVTISAVGFVGINALAYNHAWAMTHYTTGGSRTGKPEALTMWQKVKALLTGVNIPRPVGNRSPTDLAADCQTLTINSSDNATLEAWYCDRGSTTSLVILFHGYSAEKTALLDEAGHESYLASHPTEWRGAVERTIRKTENKVPEDIGANSPNSQH